MAQAEKAYTQMTEAGRMGRDAWNGYPTIHADLPNVAVRQITGLLAGTEYTTNVVGAINVVEDADPVAVVAAPVVADAPAADVDKTDWFADDLRPD